MEKSLSKRELQIVAHVKRGLSNRQIAAELALSFHTVKVHLNRIYSKMGLYEPGRNKRVSMAIKAQS